MKTGTFVYLLDGRPRYVRVRECPNPAESRALLEDLLGLPVRWQEAR